MKNDNFSAAQSTSNKFTAANQSPPDLDELIERFMSGKDESPEELLEKFKEIPIPSGVAVRATATKKEVFKNIRETLRKQNQHVSTHTEPPSLFQKTKKFLSKYTGVGTVSKKHLYLLIMVGMIISVMIWLYRSMVDTSSIPIQHSQILSPINQLAIGGFLLTITGWILIKIIEYLVLFIHSVIVSTVIPATILLISMTFIALNQYGSESLMVKANGNSLIGSPIQDIQGLNLEKLILNQNNLSGNIPPEIGKLNNLAQFVDYVEKEISQKDIQAIRINQKPSLEYKTSPFVSSLINLLEVCASKEGNLVRKKITRDENDKSILLLKQYLIDRMEQIKNSSDVNADFLLQLSHLTIIINESNHPYEYSSIVVHHRSSDYKTFKKSFAFSPEIKSTLERSNTDLILNLLQRQGSRHKFLATDYVTNVTGIIREGNQVKISVTFSNINKSERRKDLELHLYKCILIHKNETIIAVPTTPEQFKLKENTIKFNNDYLSFIEFQLFDPDREVKHIDQLMITTNEFIAEFRDLPVKEI